jgi:sphingomyelin phosphodiesterase acid-like 3
MDEMRLFEADNAEPTKAGVQGVAIKMVSSISPVDGNNPSFTVARVDPSTALLQDYEVTAASNQTGVNTKWSKEYDYAETYHEPQFSPGPLSHLIAEFREDRDSKLQVSNDYMRDYFVGDRSFELKPFWPQYVCALTHASAKSYASCVCANGK